MRPVQAIFALCIAFVIVGLAAQPCKSATKPTADEILALVQKNYSQIRDYSVEAEFSADMKSPKVYISKSRATIYFKRPNKVKVVAKEGFAVLPETFQGDPVDAIKRDFKVESAGSGKIGKEPVYVMKLTPKTTEANGTMKLYIEKRRSLILGTDMDVEGLTIKSRWSYTRIENRYWLPSQIKVEMFGQLAPPGNNTGQGTNQHKETIKGKAEVKFNNYRVNKGISDSVFKEKKKK